MYVHMYVCYLPMYMYVDVDECEMEMDMCDDRSRADCNNTIGSYECRCRSGFTGDGFNCSGDHFFGFKVAM